MDLEENVKINDVVYVSNVSSYSSVGAVMFEVAVTAEIGMRTRKGKPQPVFKGKVLRNYSLKHGWYPASKESPPYTFEVNRTYASKEMAFKEVIRALDYAKLSAENSLKVSLRNLELAQKSLLSSNNYKAELMAYDSKTFFEEAEAYISPFTGKQM